MYSTDLLRQHMWLAVL